MRSCEARISALMVVICSGNARRSKTNGRRQRPALNEAKTTRGKHATKEINRIGTFVYWFTRPPSSFRACVSVGRRRAARRRYACTATELPGLPMLPCRSLPAVDRLVPQWNDRVDNVSSRHWAAKRKRIYLPGTPAFDADDLPALTIRLRRT